MRTKDTERATSSVQSKLNRMVSTTLARLFLGCTRKYQSNTRVWPLEVASCQTHTCFIYAQHPSNETHDVTAFTDKETYIDTERQTPTEHTRTIKRKKNN